jgi:hypothetical protein
MEKLREEVSSYCRKFRQYQTGKTAVVTDINGVSIPFSLQNFLDLAMMADEDDLEVIVEIFRGLEKYGQDQNPEDFLLSMGVDFLEKVYKVSFAPFTSKN